MEDTKLYELIHRFEESSLTLLHLEEGDLKIRLERTPATDSAASACAASADAASAAADHARIADPAVSADHPAGADGSAAGPAAAGSKTVPVKAPLVGVFYAAPKPEEAPFVQTGQEVRKGQVLCLVEAMKMMNELPSPVDGIVRAIHGRNGELVEFDQVLFEIEVK